jgi:hypothetical protein
MASWWADDALWDAFAPHFFTAERVERAAAELKALVRLFVSVATREARYRDF